MLYKLKSENEAFSKMEAVAFKDLGMLGQREKHLEELIARHLLDVLYEDATLMPIYQERQWQPEADIYALNRNGDLTIFELKRRAAGEDAVLQALRYAQTAGQWNYEQLEKRYQQYSGTDAELNLAHREAFQLHHPLDAKEINRKQSLVIIGSGADEGLIDAIDYWRRQGISISFSPYRIYEIAGDQYFEFFAPPYDRHKNPGDSKGVLFDTNRSWDEDAIWYMAENERIAAYGDAQRYIDYLMPGDIVFLSHKWVGLVAAARVKRGLVEVPSANEKYRDIEFLTPVPSRDKPLRGMPFAKVSEVTGKSFFWARTVKVPYLSMDEANHLAIELAKYLQVDSATERAV